MNLTLTAASLLLPACAAYGLSSVACRDFAATGAFRALRIILAVGMGLGLSSCTFFLWMVLVGRPDTTYLLIDSLLSLCVIFFCRLSWHSRPRISAPFPAVADRPGSLIRPVTCLFALVFIGAITGLISQALAHPEGSWDAWAIWNLRARFLFRAGDDWRLALTGAIDLPDYPLLLPASLARVWTTLGGEAAWVGPGLAIVFTLLTAGLLMATVAARRGMVSGLLAGMVLLGTVRFLRWGAAQYADIPLSFFFLATLALLMIRDEHRAQRDGMIASQLLAIAGLTAALSAWTKNEGLVFLAVILSVQTVLVGRRNGIRRAVREGLTFLGGAFPVLALVVFLKSQAVHRNLLVAGQGLTETTDRLFDAARHITIAWTFLGSTVQVIHAFAFIIPVSFFLLGRYRDAGNRTPGVVLPAGVIGLMLAAYYGIYLTTPLELKAHLATSIDRLVLQLWPMAVFAVFMHLRSPADILFESGSQNASTGSTTSLLIDGRQHADSRARAA